MSKIEEAGDPRNRLPRSQLVSPGKGGGKRGREYMPVVKSFARNLA